LFSSYHLSPKNLCDYVGALNRFEPEIIDGYPSAIHIVADYILRTGTSLSFKTRAILVSAETVLPHQRQAIEKAFGAKLYNQYASSEGAPFISECAYGRLHVHPDSGVIEIIDTNGDPAAPGEMGQMVVTSFTTHIVPMLRFAMGDAAVPAPESAACPCGLQFPMVEAVVGRVDDVLYTPDRGFVGHGIQRHPEQHRGGADRADFPGDDCLTHRARPRRLRN
jgi:phenylacetate-CoA ligase